VSGSLYTLIPALQPFAKQLIQAAANARMNPRVTSTRRSTAEQARLYQRFVAGQSQYPVAPPGTSAHEFGYAFDMIVSYADWLPQLGHLWQSWGGVWGGTFNDPIHFEYPGFPKQAPHPKAWDTAYKYLNYASYLFTPLTVQKNPPEYQGLDAEIVKLLGL
jgi:D-alanyl-D-alanine carboxypeptidase